MDTYESVQLKERNNINCFVKYTPWDAGDKPSGWGGALKTIPPGNSIFFLLIIVLSCVNTRHKGISGSPADDNNHRAPARGTNNGYETKTENKRRELLLNVSAKQYTGGCNRFSDFGIFFFFYCCFLYCFISD